ncbi:uncharacterized protein LOC143274892 [Babylonia areolata]|uniref:uncharacterized protein LOC143274892 n=1 Tax=Babylonia areolata TaxID=304850 RepID=UPI003FD5C570
MESSARGATPPDYLVNANERQYLAKLCWLLHDAGTHVLRSTFDSFHPPLSLRQHLGQHHVRAVLQKLHEQKILSDKQWRTLYPTKKQDLANLSSETFDARVLAVLLQFICHLSPPYPHGWSTLPLAQDSSLSADVVRIQMYLQQAGSLGGVRHEEYPVLWKQVVEVLLRMGGPEVRVKIARIDQETLTPEQQAHYIGLVKAGWGSPDEGALGRLRRLGAGRFLGRGVGRVASNNKRRPGEKGPAEQEGISAEERVVLNRCHRQLCDMVMAEDIVDRLVQGHVFNFADRQEILTPGKNLDRMQILLSKMVQSRVAGSFKVLMENLKVKYPRVYEAMLKVRTQVLREGVSEVMDQGAVCQEGLATHYRSLFSRVTPLPWGEGQTSIRDVYVPLDVSTEEGHKLQLSNILPAVVTSGRGKRVLVEGESGSGKTYLAAMLTYQWASQSTYFSSHYRFLIYLDARLVRGPLAKAVHSLVLPESSKISPEELWGLLEAHARDTVFIIDGFDEDHSNEELKKVILGDKLRHASVLLTSRPEARAARLLSPDERLYVLGLSNVNIGRCLKTYAVIAQMTSEEYDRFNDVINSPEFEIRSQLATPYACLLLFGVFLTNGVAGLSSLTTLTSLLQRFLVAMATSFLKKLGVEMVAVEGGRQFSPELVAAISEIQALAYRSLVSRRKLLSEAEDLPSALQHLRGVLEEAEAEEEEGVGEIAAAAGAGNYTARRDNNAAASSEGKGGGGGGEGGSREEGKEEAEGEEEEKGGEEEGGEGERVKKGVKWEQAQEDRGTKGNKPAVVLTDAQLLCRVGLLHRVGVVGGGGGGGAAGGRWAFTCSMTREFLAARHLADMSGAGLGEALGEQKMLRHPRFAQTTSFLCALLQHDPDPAVPTSLLEDIAIQAMKHGRRINFKDDASTSSTIINGHAASENGDGDGEEVNGVGSHVSNFTHCLQALAECSPSPSTPSSSSTSSSSTDPAAELLPKSLPRSIQVQRDGLIPVKVLQGLSLAVTSPAYHLTHLEIELVPYLAHQGSVLQGLARALAGKQGLQGLVVRWHTLPLLVTFLTTCLSETPALHSVALHDVGRQPVGKVSAATWAGLHELCTRLRRTRSVGLLQCRSGHVVSQWVLYLPPTVRALDFTGCAFNSISAADLGAKLESSDSCNSLNLADTFLETSDLSALFHDLKLNSSLHSLSLANSHLDRSATAALAHYLRLNTSLRRLDLSHCHVTNEACRLLAEAMKGNYSLCTVDLTDAAVSEEGRQVLLSTKEAGEITWLGFEEEFYS